MLEKKPFERLPKYAVPVLYDLFLKPNLKAYTFEGITKININIVSETKELKLHVIDLDFKKVQLELADGKVLTPETKISTEDETITLTFSETLPVGEVKLLFEYVGELNDKMKGFYRSKYRSVLDDEDRYMAVTQFESTDARRCFPCWDEPAVKAKFSISLSVPNNKVALSNMPVKSESPQPDGHRLLQFETSPIMSTYLVAVVVGEFDYVEETSSDGVLVRVYTPVGKREQGQFALHVASKVLPFYKEYFNIAYPLPKIDLVAVPDFSCGAMENWGLVTYREVCLLVDSQNTSAITRQNIALVVGHELAHQWFGNLVTMEWWTHLWLNEGYASFVEFLCVHHLFPEYDIWTQFVTDNLVRALELDALKSSHPIEIPVGHPSEVEEIFDDISYNKGASIIRMLQKYIGDSDFRKGMHLYLTRHQYSNAFTEDLWAALEEASSKPIGRVMSTWTQQMGFPVISVDASVQNEDGSRTLTLSQTKFSADGSTDSSSDSLWYVPLSFCTQANPSEEVFSAEMSTRVTQVTIPDVSPGHWIKLNPGTVGYYRVKYPRETLAQFIPSVEDKSIPPLDRLSLLDDLFALAQVGEVSLVEVLKMIQSMTHEDNYTVWITICNCLQKIDLLLSNTEYHHLFYQFGVQILKPAGQSLGWEPKANENHLNTLLRSLIISRLGVYGDPDTLTLARAKFEAHVKGTAILPADLRSPVYRAAIAGGSEATYQQLLKLYQNSDMQEEKDRISRSFSALKDPELLRKVLDFSMSDLVRAQDSVFVIISAAQTKTGRELAWEFLKNNYATFTERYKGGLLGRLVKHTTENFASESHAQEVTEFFTKNPTSWIERTVQQSVETIRLNSECLKRDGEAVKQFLSTL
ncbi:hypothetical protein M8J75_000551 [Diaphorina citri]|nr:hypothetical protein M8J75_000551 [Diaphorina citri]